jgi:hypothetical protein
MTLGAPVANAALYLIEKVATATRSQMKPAIACSSLVPNGTENHKPLSQPPDGHPYYPKPHCPLLAAFTIASIY